MKGAEHASLCRDTAADHGPSARATRKANNLFFFRIRSLGPRQMAAVRRTGKKLSLMLSDMKSQLRFVRVGVRGEPRCTGMHQAIHLFLLV